VEAAFCALSTALQQSMSTKAIMSVVQRVKQVDSLCILNLQNSNPQRGCWLLAARGALPVLRA
jgi:hypothetical protein